MTDIQTLDKTGAPPQVSYAKLVAWWVSLPSLRRKLWTLALLRVLTALAIMLDILPMPPDMRFGWYLHHGGDQELMLRLSEAIASGTSTFEVIGIGQPLVMLPWVMLRKPEFYFDIVIPLVLINGFLLAGLSVVILGTTVKNLTDSDRVAVWSSALWALAPVITYFAFFWHFDPLILRGSNVPKIGWLNGLSDAPAAFFIMLSIMILARIFGGERPASTRQMVSLGLSLGAAILFRVHIAPIILILVAYVLVVYGWRAVLKVGLGGLIAYIPQAWYNISAFGLPFTTGYLSVYRFDAENPDGRSLSTVLTTLPFHPRHIAELLDYYLGRRPWILIPLILILGMLAITAVTLWKRRGWKAVVLLIGVPLAYLGVMSTAWPFRDDVIRFTIPAMPFLVAIVVYALSIAGQWVTRRRVGSPAEPQSIDSVLDE